jgi:hypothetical protein
MEARRERHVQAREGERRGDVRSADSEPKPLDARRARLRKRAIRLFLPEEIDALSPSPTVRMAAEEALARVLVHARIVLGLNEDERRRLRAEWANTSVVVFVVEDAP